MDQLLGLLPSREAAAWMTMAAAAVAGGALRGLTGFGAALIMAPVLSLVLSARETMCLVTLLNALPIGQKLSTGLLREVDGALVMPMAVAAALGLPAGIHLVEALPARFFGPVIGGAVIVSAVALLSGVALAPRRSLRLSLGVGALSGVLTGLAGVGGPPAILYVLGVEPDVHRARASFIVFFACLYPVALAAIALAGVLGRAELAQGLLLAPVFHCGGVLGEALYRVVDRGRLRRLALALLIVAGGLAAVPRHAAAGETARAEEGMPQAAGDAPRPHLVRGAPGRGAAIVRWPAGAPRWGEYTKKNSMLRSFGAAQNAGITLA